MTGLDNYYNKNNDSVEKVENSLEKSQADSLSELTKEIVNIKVLTSKKIRDYALLINDPYYRPTIITMLLLSKTEKKFNLVKHLLKGIELISNGIKENAEKSMYDKVKGMFK